MIAHEVYTTLRSFSGEKTHIETRKDIIVINDEDTVDDFIYCIYGYFYDILAINSEIINSSIKISKSVIEKEAREMIEINFK